MLVIKRPIPIKAYQIHQHLQVLQKAQKSKQRRMESVNWFTQGWQYYHHETGHRNLVLELYCTSFNQLLALFLSTRPASKSENKSRGLQTYTHASYSDWLPWYPPPPLRVSHGDGPCDTPPPPPLTIWWSTITQSKSYRNLNCYLVNQWINSIVICFCIQDGKLTADEFVMSHEIFAGSYVTQFGQSFHDEFWFIPNPSYQETMKQPTPRDEPQSRKI